MVYFYHNTQGAKAMREFYRDLHLKHPELEEKVWVMETHATRSPVPGDPDTYNHWMSDEDILKMARVVSLALSLLRSYVCVTDSSFPTLPSSYTQATEGHDDVVEFSGLTFDDCVDGIKGEDWVTIPPPLSWFTDKEKK